MIIEFKKLLKLKHINQHTIKQVQLTDCMYAILVFDKKETLVYSYCTEILPNKLGKTKISKLERKSFNAHYKQLVNKLYNKDYSLFYKNEL